MPYPSPADETSIVPALVLLSLPVALVALIVATIAALYVLWAVV